MGPIVIYYHVKGYINVVGHYRPVDAKWLSLVVT